MSEHDTEAKRAAPDLNAVVNRALAIRIGEAVIAAEVAQARAMIAEDRAADFSLRVHELGGEVAKLRTEVERLTHPAEPVKAQLHRRARAS